jgi:alcohol dehydrogenase class IV
VFTPDLPIIDARSHQLKMMKIQNNVCKLMVVDPNMMLTLTESQKATFSIELIAMAIEAYLSQKANFFSDMFVEKGLEILSYALDGSPSLEITTPQEVLLSQAGAMISIATASSSLGLGSILALSIYSRYHINKSLINSILLPYVLEEDAKFKESKLEKIAQIMRIDQIEGTEEKPSGAELVKLLIEYVRQKNAKNNLPTRLKDLKLTIDNLSLAIEDISQNFIVNCLPRSMTSDDIFEFVKNAF